MYISPADYYNNTIPKDLYNPIIYDIVIPCGTYVQLIPGKYDKQSDKKYLVKAWRGISKEDKKIIDRGVEISYSQVKGKY